MNTKLTILVAGLIIILMFSCDLDNGDTGDDSGSSDAVITPIPILDIPEGDVIADFVATYEQPVHDYFYEYAVRYNRVNTLVNGALFADSEKTDLQAIVGLTDAAIEEIDDFIAFCREMETWGTDTLTPAVDAARALIPKGTFTKSRVAGMTDTAYARRLIEMILDPEYGLKFTPQQISKRTGVKMEKILFLMQQVSREMGDAVDNLDVDIATEKMEYAETVRDTAGAVNSTLALATPLGAFGGSVTTLGGAAAGWVGKAKYAYTVFENTSAAVTFAGNVVNIAVPEEDISTPVKTVLEYNSYLGLIFGGAGGFTGSSKTEKALAIIGTTTDSVTTFIKVDDDGITSSTTPQLDTTTPVDLDSYEGVLPKGDYRVPSVDWDDLDPSDIPDFNWDVGGSDYWDDLYNGVVDMSGSAYDTLVAEYDKFVLDWRSEEHDRIPTEPVSVGGTGDDLPGFFDLTDADDEYADHEDLVITPDPGDFAVSIRSSGSIGEPPYDVTFSAEPNSAFLRYRLKLNWNFGDGTTLTQIVGDEDFTSEVVHRYSAEGVYTVKLQAEDLRGFTAEKEINIAIGGDLQSIIDSYKGKEAVILVPGGTYTGGYDDGKTLKVWEGITLLGSRDTSIIDATIEMFPGSRIEGFTLRTNSWYPFIRRGDKSETVQEDWNDGDPWDVEIIGNTFEREGEDTGTGINFGSSYGIVMTGEIRGNTCVSGVNTFLIVDDFSGIISDNTLKTGVYVDIENAVDSTITRNTLEDSRGMTITYAENTEISDNIITNTVSYEALHILEMADGSVCSGNTISGGTSSYIDGICIDTLSPGAVVSENTVTGMKGNGASISKLGGEVSKNTFSENGEYGVYIEYLQDSGILDTNSITKNEDGGVRVQISTSGAITDNTIQENSGYYGISVSRFLRGDISGNTITSNLGSGAKIPSSKGTGDLQPSPKIKDSNTIYGNLGTYNLYSVYEDDRIPGDS